MNQFLVAMPALNDPNFQQSVVYICEHSSECALGLIINRPSSAVLGDIFRQLAIRPEDPRLAEQPVFQGGPVQTERGFVIHEPAGAWNSTLRLGEQIGVTTSRDVLAAMACGAGPHRALVALGYAGWGAGQLESELASNAWLSTPADGHIIFDTPVPERWQAAAGLIGVDISLLPHAAGHA